MKHKTIGDEINELVEKYGNYTTGIYILERALQIAVGATSSDLVYVGGKLVSQHPRYLEVVKKDDEVLKRINELLKKGSE